ncbi:hypothetical protein [Homoserinimonas sp. A520]
MDLIIGIAATALVGGIGMWYTYVLGKRAGNDAVRERRVDFATKVIELGRITDELAASSDESVLRTAMARYRNLRSLGQMHGWSGTPELAEYAGYIDTGRATKLRSFSRERVGWAKWVRLDDLATQWVDNPAGAKAIVVEQGQALLSEGVSDGIENIKQWHSAP